MSSSLTIFYLYLINLYNTTELYHLKRDIETHRNGPKVGDGFGT